MLLIHLDFGRHLIMCMRVLNVGHKHEINCIVLSYHAKVWKQTLLI